MTFGDSVGEKARIPPSVPRGQSLGPLERAMPAVFGVRLTCKALGVGSGIC